MDNRDAAIKVLGNVMLKEGDEDYIFEVLGIIHGEELCWWWDYRPGTGQVSGESSFLMARKFDGDKPIEVQIEKLPDLLKEKLQEMKKKLSIKNDPFAPEGRLTATYDLEVSCNNERYVLTYTHTPFQKDSHKKGTRRGKRAEWQSNLAMYLLYRYFQRLGIRPIYESIASLVNEFSLWRFCNEAGGAPLTPENVRKRVQWVRKRKTLVAYAMEWEKEMLEKGGGFSGEI
ncbi:MAG: hypothetical protein AB1711_06305 [Thermodesulfobacteriota bacterium]